MKDNNNNNNKNNNNTNNNKKEIISSCHFIFCLEVNLSLRKVMNKNTDIWI